MTGENFPDALVAGTIAGRLTAPLLLVASDDLARSNASENLLAELDGAVTSIVIVGGELAVSSGVSDQLGAGGRQRSG